MSTVGEWVQEPDQWLPVPSTGAHHWARVGTAIDDDNNRHPTVEESRARAEELHAQRLGGGPDSTIIRDLDSNAGIYRCEWGYPILNQRGVVYDNTTSISTYRCGEPTSFPLPAPDVGDGYWVEYEQEQGDYLSEYKYEVPYRLQHYTQFGTRPEEEHFPPVDTIFYANPADVFSALDLESWITPDVLDSWPISINLGVPSGFGEWVPPGSGPQNWLAVGTVEVDSTSPTLSTSILPRSLMETPQPLPLVADVEAYQRAYTGWGSSTLGPATVSVLRRYRPPRYRINAFPTTGGVPPLRQRQNGLITGGPPLRHRQNGGQTGGPPLRHRQNGM